MVRNIYIITIDCLRDASVTTKTAPFFRSLPIQFSNCWSNGTWTLPSHASLLSGTQPYEHGAIARGDEIPQSAAKVPYTAKKHGFTTSLFSENPEFSSDTGFGSAINYLNEDIHHKVIPSTYSPSKDVENIGLNSAIDTLHKISKTDQQFRNFINFCFGGLIKLKDNNFDKVSYPHHGGRLVNHIDKYLTTTNSSQLLLANILEPHNPYYTPPAKAASQLSLSVPKKEQIALKAANDTRDFLLVDSPDVPKKAAHEFESWSNIISRKSEIYETHIWESDSLLRKFHDHHVTDEDLLIAVGDHGQLFGEEEMIGHQTSLHPNGIKVAFAVDPPKNWGNNKKEVLDPVSLSGIGSAMLGVITGTITSTDSFINQVVSESQQERFVSSYVDGPTWVVSKLYEQPKYDSNLIDQFRVRRIGKISNEEMYVYESHWDNPRVDEKLYEISGNDRVFVSEQEGSTQHLSDAEETWISKEVGRKQQDPDVSSRLKALGYK